MRSLQAVSCLVPLVLVALHASMGDIAAPHDPAAITGGTPVAACQWPTAVWAAGCSGTLVDPELVVLAAHCAEPSQIVFGASRTDPAARTVNVGECRRYDAAPLGPGEGTDFQWCRLLEPQFDVPIVPPLLGCEVEALAVGSEVTIVGFGVTPEGLLGVKHAVTTQVNALVPADAPVEAQIGGDGADSCQGDSGGPVFIELPDGAGWRVFGITSYGSADCTSGGFYSLLHVGMPWLEGSTGLDLSPCHTADGQWDPDARCGGFALEPGAGVGSFASACEVGPVTGRADTCGDPFAGGEDTTPPTVAIVEPEGESIDLQSDETTGTATFTVVVEAADEGWGLQHVELRVGGVVLPGASSRDVPFTVEVEAPPGEVVLRAHAFDLAGLSAQSEPLLVRVDVEDEGDGPLPELQGCGCTSGSQGLGASAGLWLALLFVRRRRSVALGTAVVSLAACRWPDPVVPPSHPAAPRPSAASPEPEAPVTRRDPEIAGTTSPASREPPALQTLVPIQLPFGPGAVVVEGVQDGSPVVLFDDEAEAIRRRVADRLAALGHEVVPVAELQRVEAAAAEGRLTLEGERRCRSPLSREEVRSRYFAGSPRALVQAQCVDGCGLHVELTGTPEGDASVFYRSPEVRRPTDSRAWLRAADRLSSTPQMIGGVIGGLFGSSHPPPIMFGLVQSIGPWREPPGESELRAAQAVASACAHPDPLVGLHWDVRIAVAADGTIARCDTTADHTQARPQDAACLCDAIAPVRYPKGPAGRRLRATAIDDGGFRPTGNGLALLQPGTEAWVKRLDEAPAIAACRQRAPLSSGLQATVVLDLAADGSIAGTQILGAIDTMEAMHWASCMSAELSKVELPCAPPGIDQLQVRASVNP